MPRVAMASASDLHCGHRSNPASRMTKNLREHLCSDALLSAIDILFLAGDVFDDLLTMNDGDLEPIYDWINAQLEACAKHNVILRVLEGTPSHDWKQSWLFEAFNTYLMDSRVNLKYVKDLSIEYIEELAISILYVPDEYNDTTEKTLTQAKNLLRQHGLEKVDVAVMHGQFEYQLPSFIRAQKHSSEEYLNLVRGPIFIGHIHTHSVNDRIIAHGSFDRTGHGQEEPKGYIRVDYEGSPDFHWQFVENTNAMRYVTLDCQNLSVTEIIEKVDATMVDVPPDSRVRIHAEASNPIFSNMEALISRYPLIGWDKKVAGSDSTISNGIEVDSTIDSLYVPITITPDNIVDLLMERVRGAMDVDSMDRARLILEENLDVVR